MPPDKFFGPTQLGEILSSQTGLADTEKLVQLRRFHRSAAEHRVDLATVVDLVFEQVRNHPQPTVVLRRVAGDRDNTPEIGIAQLLAVGDQSPVDMGLSRRKACASVKGSSALKNT